MSIQTYFLLALFFELPYLFGFFNCFLVGVARFELTNAGVKVPCLTAWLHPKMIVRKLISLKNNLIITNNFYNCKRK